MVRLVKSLVVTAVAVVLVACSESSVEAQWGRTGYGVSGTGGYAAGGYNYGVTGGVRYRRYTRWSRRAYRRGYGAPTTGYYAGGGGGDSYGSGGSYGSVGYSYDVCVACPTVDLCDPCGVIECGDGCGAVICSSGCATTIGVVSPAETTGAENAKPTAQTKSTPVYAYDYQAPYREPVARRIDTVSMGSSEAVGDNRLRLNLNVPEGAEIFINGKATTSTGTVRSYVTPPVEANRWYVFSVRAVIHRDGKAIEKTQEIRVEPNAPSTLAFNFPAPSPAKSLESPETPETLITVVAPENAKVLLAGVDTQSAGKVRTFKSRNLAAGQKWQGYHVTVQYSENGKLVTKSRKIDLVAGQTHELKFGDDAVQVASR